MKKDKKKLSTFEVLAYAFTSPASTLGFIMVSSYISAFWTDTVGIPMAVVGTIFLVARVFDGVSDVIMGGIIDKTNTKYGKAKPWLVVGAIGVMVTSILIFAVPEVNLTGKIIYSAILYFLITVVFATMSNIACPTLNNLITTDANDRIRLGSTYFIVYFIAIIATSFGLGLVEPLGGGKQGWILLLVITNVIAFILLVVSCVGIKERVKANQTDKIKLKDIGYALTHNKYFFCTMMIYLCINVYNAMVMNTGVYYSLNILNSASAFTVLTVASYVPTIIGTAITPALARKFGTSKVVLTGNILTIVGYLLILVNPRNLVWICIFIGVGGFGSGAISANINPFNAMSADYGEYKNGKAMPGVYSGAASFGTKIGSALGGAACSYILAFAGYKELAEVQSVSAQNAIIGCYAAAPGVVTILIVLFCIPFFKLEKEYDSIRAELDKRHEMVEIEEHQEEIK